MNLEILLAEVIAARARAADAERNAHEAARGLASLQRQIEAAIAAASS